MVIESFISSVIVGFIRGGKISRFANINFKKTWLFILALFIQFGIIFFSLSENGIQIKYIKQLYMLSYILLIIGIIININLRTLWVIMIGTIMNFIVFFANGGKKPILTEGLKLIGLDNITSMLTEEKLALYTPLGNNTKFSYLGNIIIVAKPYPYPQIISIGDLIVALGLFIFVQSIMLNEDLDRHKMIRFKYKGRI